MASLLSDVISLCLVTALVYVIGYSRDPDCLGFHTRNIAPSMGLSFK